MSSPEQHHEVTGDGTLTDDVTSDPARIRALAHPLRLTLLELLDTEREATATRCAELTGESVASCSFHLHQLVRYGYVERAEPRGREKPFRTVSRSRASRFDPAVPDSRRASAELAHLLLDRETARVHAWLDAATRAGGSTRADDAWALASTQTSATFWATQDELAALSAEVNALVDRFADRHDPARRPADARRAHLFAVVNADVPGDPR
ncbi:ArsR family transcriptional regulator [Sediminihabitans luteus]|uniref:ArsR family transcriptional regulator n=1 Tax=Sediminihabitans luteus TaxID=1138585 RepID=A0A2M9D103_9CELL|nr:helix-turn-helix domain-containing protein [Sediminihabitans luteus]PJJ77886.1 ArsR family transcriptional regulator [Sediminihabitans luteus]GII99756.1 hypothetical protein Slu03_21340 [Sediminihabitans luteus]